MKAIKELLEEVRFHIVNCNTLEYAALDKLERALSLLVEKVEQTDRAVAREAAALIEKLGQGWIPVSRIAEYQEHHFKAEDVGVAWNGNRIWVCLDGAALLRAKLFDGKFQ